MKTTTKLGLMLALSGSLLMTSCAGYYVYERPAEPAYERPVRPFPGAVWVEGDWQWNGGRYVFVRGYWAKPRAGQVWVRGHWEQTQRGWRWHKGYWG